MVPAIQVLFIASLELATLEERPPQHPPINRCKDILFSLIHKTEQTKIELMPHFDFFVYEIVTYICAF